MAKQRFRRVRDGARAMRETLRVVSSGERPVVLTESQMQDLQNETVGWTRLSAGKRDLAAWDQSKMQEVAFYLSRNNHMAQRVLDIIEDFVVGDGIQVTARNDRVQDAIAELWDDPVNDFDRLNGTRCREWQLWGEICLPVTESRDGFVRVGWIDPALIETVRPHPKTGLPGELVMTRDGEDMTGKKTLRIISWNDKTGLLEGDCFFRTINASLGGRRGVSELFTAADWIDALDEVLFSQIDRVRILNSHIWDVTATGADQATVDKLTRLYAEPPEPGTVRVHNEKIEWKALSPQFGAYEMSRQAKDLQAYVLGGLGVPSHWYGSGDEANLATAAVMAEPTRKMLKRKQKEFTSLIGDILTYGLQQMSVNGSLAGVPEDEMLDFEVTIPDFSGPDIAKVGASVGGVITAIQSAEDSKYISKQTARSLAASVFAELGAEIDPDQEGQDIEEDEAAARGAQGAQDVAQEQARNDALAQAKAAAQAQEDARAAAGAG